MLRNAWSFGRISEWKRQIGRSSSTMVIKAIERKINDKDMDYAEGKWRNIFNDL